MAFFSHVKQHNNWQKGRIRTIILRPVGKNIIQEGFLTSLVSLTATCRHGHSSPVKVMVKCEEKKSFFWNGAQHHYVPQCEIRVLLLQSIILLPVLWSYFFIFFSQAACSSTWILISLNEMRGSFISIFIPLLLLLLLCLLFHSPSTAVPHAAWTIG